MSIASLKNNTCSNVIFMNYNKISRWVYLKMSLLVFLSVASWYIIILFVYLLYVEFKCVIGDILTFEFGTVFINLTDNISFIICTVTFKDERCFHSASSWCIYWFIEHFVVLQLLCYWIYIYLETIKILIGVFIVVNLNTLSTCSNSVKWTFIQYS